MINRIRGLNNYDYRWMVMFDFICIGPTELFGTEFKMKIYKLYVPNGIRTNATPRNDRWKAL